MKILPFALAFFLACFSTKTIEKAASEKAEPTNPHSAIANPQSKNLRVGAERTELFKDLFGRKRLALLVNNTSKIGQAHLADSLVSLGFSVQKIFAPEHGFRGDADAGEKISNEKDAKTGLPIVSIYGKKKAPTVADLADVDAVVFDVQDVGARFFTYSTTLLETMKSCAANGKKFIVLDRPNPNGATVDGPVLLDESLKSFVGSMPLPVAHGLTMGELAEMIAGEGWLGDSSKKLDFEVVLCENWAHSQLFRPSERPSPNLPNLRAILLYPSFCLFEGTKMSVGRGTENQFQVLGSPVLEGDFCFVPRPNFGAKSPLFDGQTCCGRDFSDLDEAELFDRKRLDLEPLFFFFDAFKKRGEPFFLENKFFDKLAGTWLLREQIEKGASETEIRKSWEPALGEFKKNRKKYLIYPE